MLPSLLAEEMTVDLGGSLGTLNITYSSSGAFQDGDGIHLSPAGTASLLGTFTVRDSDIQTEVGHVLDQVEVQYMANGVLKERLDGIIVKAKNTVLESEEGPTLYDLLQYMFTVHNTGNDTAAHPDWVQRSLDNLAAGPLLQETVMDIINNDIYPFIDELTGTITIDLDTLFGRNMLWSTAVNAVMGSSTPTLATVLDTFGVDVRSLLDGLLNEYLSDSFFTSVGGVAVNMINGFASDSDGLDDVVDGDTVTLSYDGENIGLFRCVPKSEDEICSNFWEQHERFPYFSVTFLQLYKNMEYEKVRDSLEKNIRKMKGILDIICWHTVRLTMRT